jgi:hypothetical protein
VHGCIDIWVQESFLWFRLSAYSIFGFPVIPSFLSLWFQLSGHSFFPAVSAFQSIPLSFCFSCSQGILNTTEKNKKEKPTKQFA